MIEIVLPAMGEGIIEAEITRWLVGEGSRVETDEPVVEVATDKVDSEIPSPGAGTVHKILMKEGETAKIGQVLALIATGEDQLGGKEAEGIQMESNSGSETIEAVSKKDKTAGEPSVSPAPAGRSDTLTEHATGAPGMPVGTKTFKEVAFLSPAIRRLALEYELSPAELQGITGSGSGGRITKADVLEYITGKSIAGTGTPVEDRKQTNRKVETDGVSGDREDPGASPADPGQESPAAPVSREQVYGSGPSTVEEMDRMRKRIADHMVYSKRVAPHVTSFVECDVTEMVRWREGIKEEFHRKYGQKITLTTLILEAVIRALKEYPRINASVDGYRIILKQEINLGMATALPDGNLIVPVIHGADKLNLVGLAARVNELADRAKNNRLDPSHIQGGTFTVTNLGQFGNISGTPIINQPQVAILAAGAVVKKPAVVETTEGDTIGIRHMLILSMAYDHRLVDGALGGSFLKRVGDHLENFDPERTI